MKIKKINIIGFGNLGQSLFKHLNAQLIIESVFTRTIKDELITLSTGKVINKLEDISKNVDLNIVAVHDSAISAVMAKLPKDIPAVHTSGGTGIEICKGFKNCGILYPLQTFTKKSEIKISAVPFLIEANSTKFEEEIIEFSKAFLSTNVMKANSDTRRHIHLSAIITNNFFTYFLGVAEGILQKKDIPLEVLTPLLAETFRKTMAIGPQKSITGPAVRGDIELINKYSEMIRNDEFKEIFNQINSEISRRSFNVL